MTTVTFPRKEFEKHIKLTSQIIEKISLFGTPLEKINNEEIEIEIFPNRPDLISMRGFLRGFMAFLGKDVGLKKYTIHKFLQNYKVKISSSVKPVRPFTTCAIVKNLKFDNEKIKELINLQEKLHLTLGRNRKKVAIGIYPLEKIKLPISYKALPPEKIKFVPLDKSKEMTARQILAKHETGKEFAHLLEKESAFPVFTDASNKILSMPPIINSHDTGRITQSTKEVFIECSGHDFETLSKTLNIIVTTLAEITSSIFQMQLIYGGKKIITPDLTPEKTKINLDNINQLLGLKLKEKDLEILLPKMGFEYKNHTVTIPAWRTDILHEVDIAEDIAIAYGYENLTPEIPNISTTARESTQSKLKSSLSLLLIGLGLAEISTYHLIKSKEAALPRVKEKIEVEDSKTEYKILRPSLLTPMLRILSENKDRDYPQNLFEIGIVFSPDKEKETGIKENLNLIIALSPSNFTGAKQILDYLVSSFGIKLETNEQQHPSLIEGRAISIHFHDQKIGYLGEIHPETLRAWNIKMPVSVLEISLEDLLKN